ncbi:MAG TPA: heparin lyase I family protein [Burkholderiales bacterium]|nr:heparin lyase I family protein [Burkholderiales bacterium]
MHYSSFRRTSRIALATAALGLGAPLAALAQPSVYFVKPASGGTISGNIYQSSACEVRGSNIKQVRFWLNSTALNTENNSPWNCDIDTRKFANGTYTLKATAYDSSGRTASSSISVKIANSTTSSTTSTTISSADILGQASGNTSFSSQSNYTAQVLGTFTSAPSIPESGIHGTKLSNGETLRMGKQTDPTNSARKALAFQLAYSDPNTSGSKRSEISMPKNIEMNKVYWIAFRAYVRDWGSESTAGLFGTQVHSGDNSRGLSPSFSIYMSGARNFQIQTRYSTSSSPSQGNSITVRHGDRPIPFGRWVDFVFKFKHNTSGNGFLQAWMDGTQIVDYRGNLGFNTGHKDYAKFGVYKWVAFNTPRKVLIYNPVLVADPTGSKYTAAALRSHVNR